MEVKRTHYIDQLKRSMGNGLIKIVTGLRRSGKSYLLKKQSAFRIPDEDMMIQEKRSLKLAGDSFHKVLIVGEHTKPWRDDDGILTISIYDFLTRPEVIE